MTEMGCSHVKSVQSQGQSYTELICWPSLTLRADLLSSVRENLNLFSNSRISNINNLSRTLFMFFNLLYFSVCVVKREVENRKHDRRNALLRIFSINNIFISRSAPIKMQIKSLGLWKLFLFKFCTRYLTTYLTCFLKLNKLQTANWYLQLYLLAAGFWYFKKFNQSSFYVK